MNEQLLSGHCYCGSVKFEVIGEPLWVSHCHCESCRRHTGSVMTSFAGYHPDQIVFTGAMPTRFPSDDDVVRSFCGQCGSPIAYETVAREDEMHLYLGLFDDLEKFQPQDHSFYAEKISWFSADEHLPKHAGLTAETD